MTQNILLDQEVQIKPERQVIREMQPTKVGSDYLGGHTTPSELFSYI